MTLPERVLRIDLASEQVTSETIPSSWLRSFIGGKGLGARYLYELLDPGIDPLGPANVLCLLRGPFSGYLPGETRYVAITKSPLTDIFVDSYSGGSFADEFVSALDDHAGVIIEGVADEPVSITLEEGTAEIQSVQDRWGMDVPSLDDSFDGAVAGIGQAGEAQVRYATIATDGGDHHAGRGGTGAVMGSKRLKAIVARGEPEVNRALEAVRERYERRFQELPEGRAHSLSGTLETVDAADAVGVLPTDGWRSGSFKGSEEIGIEAIRAVATGREGATRGVPGDFEVDDVIARGGTGIALGANLGIGDVDEVLYLARLCDTLGLDIIETGSALVWAMLANEEGLIDREVKFGSAEDAATLIGEIATRSSPLGDSLADGVDAGASRLGGTDLVPTVKSMATASFDPRPAPSMGLAFATSDRGACHRRSQPVFAEILGADWDDSDRVKAVRHEQDTSSLLWCYIVDDVTRPAFEDDLGIAYFDALGIDLTRDELATIGERVWTLTRLFNIREGFDREDDRLPPVFTLPLEASTGRPAIDPEAFGRLLTRYYATRRWSVEGIPTVSLLEDIGLDAVVDQETPVADDPA